LKWAHTMTTSDLPKEFSELSPDLDPAGSAAAVAAGLPDPAVLTQLANEFFRDVPGLPRFSNAEQFHHDTGRRPVSQPTLDGQIPTEQQLRSLVTNPAESGSAPTFPGIAGGVSASNFSSVPSFSFIDEARSLYAATPTQPVPSIPALSTLKIPYESDVRQIANTLGTPALPTASLPTNAAAPQIPGTVSHDLDRFVSFDFLEQARSLNKLESPPSVSPVAAEQHHPSQADLSSIPFDVNAIRRDFPILQERVNGRQLVWLDNAATTQKPNAVIDRLSYFYQHENSNIHRAAHALAARATDAYEASREKVRRFINASSPSEIIFVRGATEGINLIAQSWGKRNIQKDDEIVVTWLEHHANIVPWQMLAAEKGAKLRVAPVDNTGQIILEEYEKLLNPRTRLVSLSHVSNALGTITPVQEMVAMAHRHGARVVVDGAQSVSHLKIDVQAFDTDFFVFSGHKVFAPTGIGVVYGKPEVLKSTPPWQGGGNMIADVTFEKTVYQDPPNRFEAGTGSIGDAVGLGAAIDYLDRIGMVNITRYEHDLLVYAMDAMQQIPGLHLIGTAKEKASVLSFVLDGFRTEDVGNALNEEGIAVRSGHHCAQPILRRFGQETTVRPSLAMYNTCEEIDLMVAALWNLKNGRGASIG
jgi:cysteine desulfurase/selenocysteine lyase